MDDGQLARIGRKLPVPAVSAPLCCCSPIRRADCGKTLVSVSRSMRSHRLITIQHSLIIIQLLTSADSCLVYILYPQSTPHPPYNRLAISLHVIACRYRSIDVVIFIASSSHCSSHLHHQCWLCLIRTTCSKHTRIIY